MTKVSVAPGWQRALIVLTGTVVGVVVVSCLYWAQRVLVPVALAVFLTFLLTPLVGFLQRRGLRRMPAVVLVALLAALGLGRYRMAGYGRGQGPCCRTADLQQEHPGKGQIAPAAGPGGGDPGQDDPGHYRGVEFAVRVPGGSGGGQTGRADWHRPGETICRPRPWTRTSVITSGYWHGTRMRLRSWFWRRPNSLSPNRCTTGCWCRHSTTSNRTACGTT